MRDLVIGVAVFLCPLATLRCADDATPGDERGGAGEAAGGPSGSGGGAGKAAGAGGAAGKTGGSGGATGGTGGATGGTGGATAGSGGSTAGTGGSAGGTGGGRTDAGPPETVGEWVNVTPPGIKLYPLGSWQWNSAPIDNYGVQEMIHDPAHPGTFYAGTSYEGIWKSVDYGLTWTKVSKDDSGIDRSRTVCTSITPDGSTIYSDALYGVYVSTIPGAQGAGGGFWKSTDGAVTWTEVWVRSVPATWGLDVATPAMDPADPKHLIVTLHGNAGDQTKDGHVFETFDGAETWIDRGQPLNAIAGGWPFFIDSKRWLIVYAWNTNEQGTMLTEDSGTTWTRVSLAEHMHGAEQPLIEGDTIYLPGIGSGTGGIAKSTDGGHTWEQILVESAMSAITATPTHLYATAGQCGHAPEGGVLDPRLRVADRSNDKVWKNVPAPAGMVVGPKRMEPVFDGHNWVIVAACADAGIWRYVEP
jgi:hypothetical protein